MSSARTFTLTLTLASLALATTARSAAAAELQVATGPTVQGSSWRGDASVGPSLKAGLRLKDIVAIDALTRLGYATVDQRMLTYLSLGVSLYGSIASGRVRPFGRLAVVHQHEEPMAALRQDPGGAIFGVGDGIRHRGGFGGALGLDVVVLRSGATEVLLGADTNGTWFVDPRGPSLYFGGGLWAGINYSL